MFLSYSLVVLSLFYLSPLSSKPLQLVRHPNGAVVPLEPWRRPVPEFFEVSDEPWRAAVDVADVQDVDQLLLLPRTSHLARLLEQVKNFSHISQLFFELYLHIHNGPFTVCYSNYCLGTKGTTQVFQEREVDKGKLQACSSTSSSSTPSSWAGSLKMILSRCQITRWKCMFVWL